MRPLAAVFFYLRGRTMFADRAKIIIRSGKGGDGHISFRREKYVPDGGPDGGDGGRGGDVIFEVDDGLNTLYEYRHRRKFAATDGEEGGKKRCHGKDGQDIVLKVPEGTVVREAASGQVIADLSGENRRQIVLKGGQGGNGNMHYATSTMQAPKYAQPGQEAMELEVQLELNERRRQASATLRLALCRNGYQRMKSIADGIHYEHDVTVDTRVAAGVRIPTISVKQGEFKPQFGFVGTDSLADKTMVDFLKLTETANRLAELETSVWLLARELKKTQRRVNALEHIFIPNYKDTLHFIEEQLESRELDSFFTMKMVKKRLEAANDAEYARKEGDRQ